MRSVWKDPGLKIPQWPQTPLPLSSQHTEPQLPPLITHTIIPFKLYVLKKTKFWKSHPSLSSLTIPPPHPQLYIFSFLLCIDQTNHIFYDINYALCTEVHLIHQIHLIHLVFIRTTRFARIIRFTSFTRSTKITRITKSPDSPDSPESPGSKKCRTTPFSFLPLPLTL